MALIIKRKPTVAADPLVEDAVKAKPVMTEAEITADRAARFPGPKDERKLCPYCGHAYYLPCVEHEYERCMNYKAALKRKERGTGQ